MEVKVGRHLQARASVRLHMSTLISTWACYLLLRWSGSENKQSPSYLAWAGKVDSAEQAALVTRTRMHYISPPPSLLFLPSLKMAASSKEKAYSGWQQMDFFKCWDLLGFVFQVFVVTIWTPVHDWLSRPFGAALGNMKKSSGTGVSTL